MDFHDYEAEQKFVSCILNDADPLLELDVNPQWFEMYECQSIVTHALRLANDGVDYTMSLEPLLHRLTEAGEQNGNMFLTLEKYRLDYVPSFHASHYLDRIKSVYRKRQMQSLGARIVQAAVDGDENILSRARAALDELERRTDGDNVTMLTADYLLTTDFPEPRWIIPDLLPVGLAFFAGKPKVGKSWMGLQMSLAAGTGTPFLGKPMRKQKVLYIAQEDYPRRLSERIKKQGWKPGSLVRFITPEQIGLIGPLEKGGVDKILALVSRYRFSLIIIDTLTRSIDSDQFSPQDMAKILSPLQSGALKLEACIMVVDHMPKMSGSDGDVITDVYGSISKVGIADTIMGFYRDRGSNTGKFVGVGRDIDEFVIAVKYIEQTGMWVPMDSVERVRYSELRHNVLRYVYEAKNASVGHVAAELEINKGSVSRVLKELAADNLLIVFNEGRHVIYGVSQVGQTVLERWNTRVEGAKQILLTE